MIEIQNLTKQFGSFKALDGINCSIPAGSVYGLVGTNGSGKSTFLRTLAGVYYPDGGNATIDGQIIYENNDVKSQTFFVPDSPYFLHQSSIQDMAEFYAMIYSEFSLDRLDKLSSIFPIDINMRIAFMSKGMQRQAALMLALACMPKYLLLDEAFDGLDPIIRQALKRLISDGISENNMTVIIASHNLRELEDLCDHVGLLHKSKMLLSSDLDSLKSSLQKVQAVFDTVPSSDVFSNMNILSIKQQGLIVNLVMRGEFEQVQAQIASLNPKFMQIMQPTLEEIFIYELGVTEYDVSKILC